MSYTLSVQNIKNFGALGNGTTNDNTAVQAAINAMPSTGGELYFPAGTYLINTATLTGIPSGSIIRGDGRGASVIKSTSGTHNLFQFAAGRSFITFQGLKISTHATGGHIFAPLGEFDQSYFRDLHLAQGNPAKSIWKQLDFGYYYNSWEDVYAYHDGATSVPAFDFTSATGPVHNANSFRRITIETTASAATWFFDFATSAAADQLYANYFTDITAEITNGGIARVRSGNGFVFRNIDIFDITTTTNSLFYIGAGAGNFRTRNTTFQNINRAGGALGASKYDIELQSGKADGTIFLNCNRSILSNYSVQLNSNSLVSVFGCFGVTFNNLSSTTAITDVLPKKFDVRWFGAKGDGTTDDAIAIQAAISVAAGVNGLVYLPASTYLIGTGLTITTSNMGMVGDGEASILKAAAAMTTGAVLTVSGSDVQHVQLRRFQINGNKTNGPTGNCLTLNTPVVTSDSNHILEDLYLLNAANDGLVVTSGRVVRALQVRVRQATNNSYNIAGSDHQFLDCIADTSGQEGFLVTASNIHLTNCKAFGCGTANLDYAGFHPNGPNQVYTSCEAQNNLGPGIIMNAGAQYCTWLGPIVDTNGFAGTGNQVGVYLNGATNNEFIGGHYFDGGSATQTYSIYVTGTSSGNSFLGCRFSGNITAGFNDVSSGSNSYTFGNTVNTLTAATTISLNPTLGETFKLTPAQTETINAASVLAGQTLTIVITTSGTSSFVVTFGTNFKSTGTLATGTVSGKVFTITFRSDGTNYCEIARTTAM